MKIKVFGVGGFGCAIVSRLVAANIMDAEIVGISFDQHTLTSFCTAHRKILLKWTPRFGGGIEAVERDLNMTVNEEMLLNELYGTDLLIVTAGAGEKTEATKILFVAKLAKELGIKTAAVVMMPFDFEGHIRHDFSKAVHETLNEIIGDIIVINSETLGNTDGLPMKTIFKMSEDLCASAIANLVKNAGNGENTALAQVEGVTETYMDAVMWYHRTADQGNAEVQCNIGKYYQRRIDVYGRRADEEAIRWYRLAADQGHSKAQCELAECYFNGDGVRKNYKKAVKYYRLAAKQEDKFAQCNLGVCYAKGDGVTQNYEEAVKWYRLAADQGDYVAQANLGWCYYHGNGVNQDYKKAVKWYQLAAKQGSVDAQSNLGMCYEKGNGVEQNHEEAVKWLRTAADQGDKDAINFFANQKN